jgi:hypothetical protein
MRRAYCLLKADPHYRRDAFEAGLRNAGFTLMADARVESAQAGDVVVIWNLIARNKVLAPHLMQRGVTVLVAENGYCGHDAQGVQYFALAKGGHNGSGHWPIGEEDRFVNLGIDLKPWRASGQHIIVVGQRGIGAKGMASPPNWHEATASALRSRTKRPVIVKPHPGRPATNVQTIAEMHKLLVDCHCVVVWASANGVRSLIEGVPVISMAPHWILQSIAGRSLDQIENPPMPDRMPAFRRLAFAQWNLDEIRSGEPIKRLTC